MSPIFLPPGVERLNSVKIPSAATSTGVIPIEPRDLLWILAAVTGYAGGGDLAGFQFNGVTTAANYTSRMAIFGTAASATVTNQSNNGASLTRIPIGPTNVTTGRTALAFINNHVQSAQKPITMMADVASTGGTTELNSLPLQIWGQFTAASAGTQITSVNMVTASANMLAGSGFIVFGINM